MTIGIDCRLSGQAHAGIGRYIENLVQRLPHLRPDIHWVYFFSEPTQAEAIQSQLPKEAHVTSIFVPIRHYSLAEQLQLPSHFRRQNLDLLHVPHFNIPLFYSKPLVVTIHDLLWHEYKGTDVTTLTPWKYWLKYAGYRHVASQAISKAEKIFVPAQTIKDTLTQYYPDAQSKIIVTKEGVNPPPHLKPTTKTATRLAQLIPATIAQHPYFVYVGSLYPHKNVRLVIQALKQLPDYRLVIVGSRTVFQDDIKKYVVEQGVNSQVHFTGYVSDENLALIYSQAFALVQPSFSEGFGLTGVEAMAHQLPVLASNIPIFKEIYQDGAIFFNPQSETSFVTAVTKLKKFNRASLVKRGLAVIKDYNWHTMAQQTLNGYLQVLQSS